MTDQSFSDRVARLFLPPASAVVILLLLPLALLVTAPFWYPVFYDRHFRSIEHKLARLPGVTIVDSWKHEDITLEDFGFLLNVQDCPLVCLNFYESHEWYGLFEKIDGIVVSRHDSSEIKVISIASLNGHGLSVRTLPDVLTNLNDVLQVCDKTPAGGSWPGPAGNWVFFRYPIMSKRR